MQVPNPEAPRYAILSRANQQNQAFFNLSGKASVHFDAMGMSMSYRRGAKPFTEGALAQNVFILRSGRLKLSVTSKKGKMVILKIAEGGQVLGLSAVLGATEYEASAEALEPCGITAISTKDFLGFLGEYPEAALEATRYILREYEVLFSDICRLALPATAAGRLANLLLDWLKSPSSSGTLNPRVRMVLTHEEIAGMTGTSRETVTRILQQFQREQIISIKGSSLTVLQPNALEDLAA